MCLIYVLISFFFPHMLASNKQRGLVRIISISLGSLVLATTDLPQANCILTHQLRVPRGLQGPRGWQGQRVSRKVGL